MFLDARDVPMISHNPVPYTAVLASNNLERNRPLLTKLLLQNGKEALGAARMDFGLLGRNYLKYAKLVLRKQRPSVRYDSDERLQSNAPQPVRNKRNQRDVKGYLSRGITKDLNK
jgi:hypothetical protein